MLPLHPTLAAALIDYLDRRDWLLPTAACSELLIFRKAHGFICPVFIRPSGDRRTRAG